MTALLRRGALYLARVPLWYFALLAAACGAGRYLRGELTVPFATVTALFVGFFLGGALWVPLVDRWQAIAGRALERARDNEAAVQRMTTQLLAVHDGMKRGDPAGIIIARVREIGGEA